MKGLNHEGNKIIDIKKINIAIRIIINIIPSYADYETTQ